MKSLVYSVVSIAFFLLTSASAYSAPGDLLGTVDLPGNGTCSVAGTFDGTYYLTMDAYAGGDYNCASNELQVFLPPVGGNGSATLVATKTIVDAADPGIPVIISELAWDPGRSRVWGAYDDKVWSIDIGDPTVSADAMAAFQFQAGVGGNSLVDGLAYDPGSDTIWYSTDVNQDVFEFTPIGVSPGSVTAKNYTGVADGRISGVVVGSALADTTGTLYIGRDGDAEIRRIKKDGPQAGDWISDFATTSGRVEALTCDPLTYAPLEAVLAKDAYQSKYEAFEVEIGTCPLVGELITCTKGFWKNHPEEWVNLHPDGMPIWGGGYSYMEILSMAPKKGDASIMLAHALIAAKLNSGAPADAMMDAMNLLNAHPVGSMDLQAKGKRTDPDRAAAIETAGILQEFNESLECPLPEE